MHRSTRLTSTPPFTLPFSLSCSLYLHSQLQLRIRLRRSQLRRRYHRLLLPQRGKRTQSRASCNFVGGSVDSRTSSSLSSNGSLLMLILPFLLLLRLGDLRTGVSIILIESSTRRACSLRRADLFLSTVPLLSLSSSWLRHSNRCCRHFPEGKDEGKRHRRSHRRGSARRKCSTTD